MSRDEAWFRLSDGPWHLGHHYGRCGVQNDWQISQTDLRPEASRSLDEWCRDCYVEADRRTIDGLREELHETQTELAKYTSERERRLEAWNAANRVTSTPLTQEDPET